MGLHVDFLHEGLAAKLAGELLLLEVYLLVALSEMVPSVRFQMTKSIGLHTLIQINENCLKGE